MNTILDMIHFYRHRINLSSRQPEKWSIFWEIEPKQGINCMNKKSIQKYLHTYYCSVHFFGICCEMGPIVMTRHQPHQGVAWVDGPTASVSFLPRQGESSLSSPSTIKHTLHHDLDFTPTFSHVSDIQQFLIIHTYKHGSLSWNLGSCKLIRLVVLRVDQLC